MRARCPERRRARPEAPLGPGLVLPMLMPAVAWLIWRAVAPQFPEWRLTMLFLLTTAPARP